MRPKACGPVTGFRGFMTMSPMKTVWASIFAEADRGTMGSERLSRCIPGNRMKKDR